MNEDPQAQQDRDQQVRTLLAAGLPIREVMRQSGASYGYVYRRAVQMEQPRTRGHANDPSHPWKTASLTRRRKEQPEP